MPSEVWKQLTIQNIERLRAIFRMEPSLTPMDKFRCLQIATEIARRTSVDIKSASDYHNVLQNCLRIVIASGAEFYDAEELFK